ncbi:hypothetical protein L1887_51787 [Cichorium endivia]|nr:hypothetical protein L1887_51787 [Cichorium endivia]
MLRRPCQAIDSAAVPDRLRQSWPDPRGGAELARQPTGHRRDPTQPAQHSKTTHTLEEGLQRATDPATDRSGRGRLGHRRANGGEARRRTSVRPGQRTEPDVLRRRRPAPEPGSTTAIFGGWLPTARGTRGEPARPRRCRPKPVELVTERRYIDDPQEPDRRPAGDCRVRVRGPHRHHLRQGGDWRECIRRPLRGDPRRRGGRERLDAADRHRLQLEYPGRRGHPLQVRGRGDHRRVHFHCPPLHRPWPLHCRQPGLHRLQQRAVQLRGRRRQRGAAQLGGGWPRPAGELLRTIYHPHRSGHRSGAVPAGEYQRLGVLRRCRPHQYRSGEGLQGPAERVLGARFYRAAVGSQPHRPGVHAALLLNPAGIERALHRGGEFTVAEELRLTGALGFRAAELELPGLAATVGDALGAARLRILQRDIVGLHLLRGQAGAHALAGHGNALLGQHPFHHRPLLRRQVLQLPEHELHVRKRLAVDLHVAGGQLPQPRLQHLRLDQGTRQANQQRQRRHTNVHLVTPEISGPVPDCCLDFEKPPGLQD